MKSTHRAMRRVVAIAGIVIIAMGGAVNAAASTSTAGAGPYGVTAHVLPAPAGGRMHLMCLACVE